MNGAMPTRDLFGRPVLRDGKAKNLGVNKDKINELSQQNCLRGPCGINFRQIYNRYDNGNVTSFKMRKFNVLGSLSQLCHNSQMSINDTIGTITSVHLKSPHVKVLLWDVDRDPQIFGFSLLMATFFMLLSDNRRGLQSTLLSTLHFTSLYISATPSNCFGWILQ